MTKYPPAFHFIDDPEGVERCGRENPNALIIHRVIVDPPKPVLAFNGTKRTFRG